MNGYDLYRDGTKVIIIPETVGYNGICRFKLSYYPIGVPGSGVANAGYGDSYLYYGGKGKALFSNITPPIINIVATAAADVVVGSSGKVTLTLSNGIYRASTAGKFIVHDKLDEHSYYNEKTSYMVADPKNVSIVGNVITVASLTPATNYSFTIAYKRPPYGIKFVYEVNNKVVTTSGTLPSIGVLRNKDTHAVSSLKGSVSAIVNSGFAVNSFVRNLYLPE